MLIPNCRKFTGYRPCEPYKKCLDCSDAFPIGKRILIINLDQLGDVLMTTAQLPAIKRIYPESHISWITLKMALPILQNNPYLDKIYEWNDENRMILRNQRFDLALNADKNLNSSSFTLELNAAEKRGFGLNENGVLIPLNNGAEFNYQMGLDDQLKFHDNQRTGQDILAETFELNYQRDEYVVNLLPEEIEFCNAMRNRYEISDNDAVIGFNTGCSAQQPFKKMTLEQHVELIKRLLDYSPRVKVLLLGGKAETERNQEINRRVGNRAIETPTTEGLRRGLLYINLCDSVVSGDTSGLHMAIALKKWIIAWFGNSAQAEIDLYNRGVKILVESESSQKWNMGTPDPNLRQRLDLNSVYAHILDFVKQKLA